MPVSDDFFWLPVANIIIPERMRQNFTSEDHTKLQSLEDSIRKYGQFSPILITRELELVAGHRRLLCHQRLQKLVIKCIYYDPTSHAELLAIELEENLKRLSMNWRSIMLGIGRYHEDMKRVDVTWDMQKTSRQLGVPGGTVQKSIAVYQFRNHPEIRNCHRFKEAYTLSRKLKKQMMDAELARAA